MTLGSCLPRLGDRGVEVLGPLDLADAEGRAGPRGLHEQRPAVLRGEVGHLAAGGARVLLPLARPDHRVRADLQPEGGEDALHVLLVHADGGREHARADVGDTGEFEQALQGAVLAVGAVQHREDDVDLAECLGHGAGLGVDHLAAARVHRQQHRALLVGDLLDRGHPALFDGHPLGLVRGQRPAALAGDADRQDVVLVAVDGPQHAGRGHHGHAVLGAAPAEDDGDARLAAVGRPLGLLVGALGRRQVAHVALTLPFGLRGA